MRKVKIETFSPPTRAQHWINDLQENHCELHSFSVTSVGEEGRDGYPTGLLVSQATVMMTLPERCCGYEGSCQSEPSANGRYPYLCSKCERERRYAETRCVEPGCEETMGDDLDGFCEKHYQQAAA